MYQLFVWNKCKKDKFSLSVLPHHTSIVHLHIGGKKIGLWNSYYCKYLCQSSECKLSLYPSPLSISSEVAFSATLVLFFSHTDSAVG